jgi:hypothetical protein
MLYLDTRLLHQTYTVIECEPQKRVLGGAHCRVRHPHVRAMWTVDTLWKMDRTV